MAASNEQSSAPCAATLIFTWGNPSRGDDALGTEAYDRLLHDTPAGTELLTDFQLQIEHAMDLEQRERVLFIDASVSAGPPFEFRQLLPSRDDSYTTHAMSPESLLAVYAQINHCDPPASFLLSIRGYEFGLGLPLSLEAAANLEQALAFTLELLHAPETGHWLRQTS